MFRWKVPSNTLYGTFQLKIVGRKIHPQVLHLIDISAMVDFGKRGYTIFNVTELAGGKVMPSAGIHLLVLDEVTAALNNSGGSSSQANYQLIQQFPEFAALGAIGPDLAFYLGAGPHVVNAINTIYSWINAVGNVFNEIGSLAGQAGLPNLDARLRQVGGTVDTLLTTAEGTLTQALFSLVSVVKGPLVPPSEIQFGKPEKEWGWGDLLHWRITGSLVRDILDEADRTGNSAWRAYALGYMTHLATDLVGHPYTNQVTGGPARSWSTRHHLAENFMDTYAYWTIKQQDINSAKLHKRLEGLNGTQELQDFADMLSNRLLQYYQSSLSTSNPLPQEPSPHEIIEAYHHMLGLFAFVTDTLYVAPPAFPGIAIPPLPGAAGSFTQQAASLFPPTNRSWTFWDFLKAILASILVGLAFVADLIRLAVDIVIGVVTYPLAVALYLAQSVLYSVYRSVRWSLVLSAIAFPAPDELSTWLGQQFIPCGRPDPLFPHRMPEIESWDAIWQIGLRVVTVTMSNYYYLNYPTTPPEEPRTLSSPYANAVPTFFINQAQRDANYVSPWNASTSPTDVDTLNSGLLSMMRATGASVDALGNARDFALNLILNDQKLAQFNLDADRGYGYYIWRASGGLPNGPVTGLQFL